jgi:hypothetical protein
LISSTVRLRKTLTAAIGACCAAAAVLAPGAGAATLVEEAVETVGTQADACTDATSGPGTSSRTFTSPVAGYLSARLDGGRGDWDLAVFSERSGEPVAGGAGPGADEVATGFALDGEKLTVQACRRAGASGTPNLTVEVTPVEGEPTPAPSLVRVATPSEADKAALHKTGVDISHSEGPDFMDVVAYGKPDLDRITRVGLAYSVRTPNLVRESRSERRAEAEAAEAGEPTTLAAGDGFPSGRTGTYRRLFDYEEELKALAEEYPKLVRLFTLPEQSYEGRPVVGIEITRRPGIRNGKPTFLQMGLHHAREWPSGEHAIEWAYELLRGVDAGDERTTELVRRTRTVVIPVVNPDGFNASREAGELQGAAGGRSASSSTMETINILTHPIEYRRKNCRFLDDSEGGSCVQPDLGLVAAGVDPNRNYGGFWGGPGASTDPTAADYRGPGPFSEPETRNIQHYMSRQQVIAFASNHTFTGLWLRPPALASAGETVDEPMYKRLGAKATRENGYENIPSYQLYDTSGGTEDWAYYSTGAIGFTPEIGAHAFHPAYDEAIAEWNGTSADFDARGGNREAYYHLAEFVTKKRSHALIKGKGPKGGRVIVKKRFDTATSPVIGSGGEVGDVQTFEDRIRTVARIRKRGRFSFHINPSTRPVVAQERGEKDAGPPSDPQSFSGEATTTTPCADYDTEDETCFNDHPIVVPDEEGRSNASANVRIEWASEVSDWDLKIFRDTDGDGSSVGETDLVGASGSAPTSSESAAIANLEPGERYVARVINYAAFEPYEGTVTFQAPEPFQPARTERWRIVAKNRKGKVVERRGLHIERGEVKRLNLR